MFRRQFQERDVGQVLVNSFVAAAGYLLVGLGFSLIYTSARFFHFAHGVVLTSGAYTALVLRVGLGLPLWLALSGGILGSALLGVAMEVGIYRPMRKRSASPSALLLSSMGMYVTLQAIITIAFGSGTKSFKSGGPSEGLAVLGTRITAPQIAMIVISAACFLLTWFFLQKTREGKMIRAVSQDPELAKAYGLDGDRLILLAFLIGSVLAGVASLLLAYDTDMNPLMGFQALLMGMIAVIIGGVGRLPGAVLGAIFLALVSNLAGWWISSIWQDTIVFLMLVLFLLFRPQGFFGKPLRSATV
jgi:branched-chain amino acid transport system permease protein